MAATVRTRYGDNAARGMARHDALPHVLEPDAAGAADFERLLMQLSTSLAGARWDEVSHEVDRALAELLEFFALDQGCLFEVLAGGTEAFLRHEASAAGLPALPERMSYGLWFPWIFAKTVLAGEAVCVAAGEELPVDASADRSSMQAFCLASVVHIPLQIEGEVRFVLCAGRTGHSEPWSTLCVSRLKALGQMLAFAIARAAAVGSLYATRQDDRDTLALAHLGRWEWDIGAGRLHLSEEAKHVLGADVPDIAGLIDLVYPADRERVARTLERCRAQPGRRSSLRYSIRTPAGEARAVRQWQEVIFPGERTARLVAMVQDASALSNDHEIVQLREHQWHSVRVAQTALLVASLAHELSQPLSAILTNAQAGLRFLHNDALDREDMQDILTDIVASNRRASEVLSALRAMLKRQHTTRITFDAADAVNDVLALVRSELMTQMIEVETSLAAGCYLTADKTQVEQVLLNLIMNAIDAMRGLRDARRLQLTLSAGDAKEVQLAVTDTGRGISTDDVVKVFEAFWTTKKQGLGIGLPVCRAIVESYGGRIWCEKHSAGGVTFRLTLPSAEQQHA